MASKKSSRGKRKASNKQKNSAFCTFVKNKWNGIEPYEVFLAREMKFWANYQRAGKVKVLVN